jgi:haloalkane dehalogenase
LSEIWDRIDVLTDKPTLIVWGLKDIAFRKTELKRWERTFAHARSVHLPTVGHFVQEEAPKALGDAMADFLV